MADSSIYSLQNLSKSIQKSLKIIHLKKALMNGLDCPRMKNAMKRMLRKSLPDLHINPESHLGSNLDEKIKTSLLLRI